MLKNTVSARSTQNIMKNESFRQGKVDTGFILTHADELNVPPPSTANIVAEAAKRAKARKASKK